MTGVQHAGERTTGRLWPVVLLAAVMLCVAFNVRAGDEDTSSNVYLVFDPETGDFVTVDDPNKALPNQTGVHDASGNTASSSGHAAAGSSTTPAAAHDAGTSTTSPGDSSPSSGAGGSNLAILAGVVVVGLLLAVGLVFRKRQSRTSSAAAK